MQCKFLYIILSIIVATCVFSSNVFAFNACLSNATIQYINNDTVLTGLSNICDKQDMLSSNLNSTLNTIITLINTNQNLTNTINNISIYISSGAINTSIANAASQYLSGLPSMQNYTQALVNLSIAVAQVADISAFRQQVDIRFDEVHTGYVTKSQYDYMVLSLNQNITDLQARFNIIETQPKEDNTFAYVVIVAIVIIVVIGAIMLLRKGKSKPQEKVNVIPLPEYVGSDTVHPGIIVTDRDLAADKYISRKKVKTERNKRTEKALTKLKK